MQTQRTHRLERVLTLTIALALIFAGLCIYVYLVEVYESHWTRGRVPPHLQAGSYVRWAPIESKAVPGYPETFQSHAWSTLPADALETLLLLSQDRHASGVVHGAQSADTTPYTTEVGVETQTFNDNESEEASLRPDTRTGNALRGSQGQYGIGVFAAQKMRQRGARDNVTRNIRVWLLEPRPEGDTAIRVVPWLASAPQQPQHVVNTDPPFTQATLPSTGAEPDTGILDEKEHIFAPNHYIRGEFNISSSPNLVTTRERIAVLAKTINDGLPLGDIADNKETWRIFPACIHEGDNDRFFHVNEPLQNNELVIGPSEPALGSAQDADVVSSSAISDLYLYPEYEGSFKLVAVDIHPFVIEKGGHSKRPQPRLVTSRIVGRGVSLIREDVE